MAKQQGTQDSAGRAAITLDDISTVRALVERLGAETVKQLTDRLS